MRYLSVCSGIEAASVAWEPLGWQPAAFAEIEPFPAAVLAHHWPSVPNLGDMNNYEEWKLDSIGVLVGGTPCQSFSVAGLRKGLHDARGGLMLTYLEIARRFRPRWLVWENVPGVLSSNGGRDFGSFLGALGELGYGWAYRVLDAQWVRTQRHPRAVPQRRRRVFVVGCLGDPICAAKVLFESQSLCRDYKARGKKKESVAGAFTARARSGGGFGTDFDCDGGVQVAGALDTQCGGGKLTHQTLLNGHALVTGALSAEDGAQGHTTVQAAKSGMLVSEIAPPLTRSPYGDNESRDGILVATGDGETADPRTAHEDLAVPARMAAFGEYVEDNTASTMKARDFRDATDLVSLPRAVRRLTPTECERLQGFPDGHTLIPWKGKPADQCPDGPRYKALGNSMAVNCMEWIGQRIAFYDNHNLTTP